MTKEEAIEILSVAHLGLSMRVKDACEMAIEALKRDDPEVEFKKRFEKTTFCGYSAEKLLMFADACKRNNITEEELHDFCLNAESAFNYILSKIQEESAKRLS